MARETTTKARTGTGMEEGAEAAVGGAAVVAVAETRTIF
jgi:hypothetical protein